MSVKLDGIQSAGLDYRFADSLGADVPETTLNIVIRYECNPNTLTFQWPLPLLSKGDNAAASSILDYGTYDGTSYLVETVH